MVETLGKNGGVSSHTRKLQEKIKEKLIRFWRIVLLTHCAHSRKHLDPPVMSWRKVVYCRFFQFWLNYPNRNYKSRSIEYNFNWCWHHALHLRKKTLPILENLVTTSRTTTKGINWLKIPLTSTCVVVRTSSPGSRLRQFFPNSPPPELLSIH